MIKVEDYLDDLRSCELCEWRCGVDRLSDETGVCRMGKPELASSTLHPAPPQSYTVFMTGCNFKCLNCQNWTIAHYPDSEKMVRGFIEPKRLAKRAFMALNSEEADMISADRIFFSGGSPTPSLPYIEKVVEEARKLGEVKVNYDTNGFMTESSLSRILKFTNSITFDIKAYHDDIHRSLTGAPVDPVLRNARRIAEKADEKLWEFRVPLIPGINEEEVRPIAKFISETDPELPLNFLAFRPNFVLENHPGATRELMERAVNIAEETGLEDVSWSGRVGISGEVEASKTSEYEREGAKIAGEIAKSTGCNFHPRSCGNCVQKDECPIKNYRAKRST